MAKHESVWSWVTSRVQGRTQRQTDKQSVEMQEENPWFSLQRRFSEPTALPRQDLNVNRTSELDDHSASQPPRWLSGVASPYGFSDDDGTLKQVERQNWQPSSEAKRTKRFIPAASSTSSRWQTGTTGIQRSMGGQRGSTWMLQSICAIVLVAGALYAHQSQSAAASRVQSVFQDMFEHDYTQTTLPAVQQFLDNHHLSFPALSKLGAVRLHPPMTGTIETDYSTTHPEMVITGDSGEAVTSAGSGTVTKVVKLSSGIMIRIDHGSVGATTYVGLADASVRQQEYVSSGQIIGHLPKSAHPQLEFTLEKQGHYVDPHDEISFATNGV